MACASCLWWRQHTNGTHLAQFHFQKMSTNLTPKKDPFLHETHLHQPNRPPTPPLICLMTHHQNKLICSHVAQCLWCRPSRWHHLQYIYSHACYPLSQTSGMHMHSLPMPGCNLLSRVWLPFPSWMTCWHVLSFATHLAQSCSQHARNVIHYTIYPNLYIPTQAHPCYHTTLDLWSIMGPIPAWASG